MEHTPSFNIQERLDTKHSKEKGGGSMISSVYSIKPSESGYGSGTASIRSGLEQSKSGSGSGTGSNKSKSLSSDSASASTINSSENGQKVVFGKDSLKKRSLFKSLKPPTPDVSTTNEDLKISDIASTLSQGQKTPCAKEARALQAVALTRALDCIQKISDDSNCDEKRTVRSVLLNPEAAKKVAKEVKLGLKEKGRDWRALLGPDIVTDMSQSFAFLEKDAAVKRKDCFFTAISLDTGCVVYVTSSMTDKLAFHCDMWTGRNLLDFLHPKDRLVFTNFVTSGLMGTPGSSTLMNPESGDPSKQSLCVRFRLFKSFKSNGFSITEKKTSYLPFKLNLKLHKQKKHGDESGNDQEQLFVLIQATPIQSAYSHSDQTFSTGQFCLRHNSGTSFNEVDPASIPLLGHLPQDLIGSSALDFYHPSDLAILRDTYSAVLQRQGKPVRSMPFHFRAQNGCYVLLETDWSCFINPWSKKLEFVVGNHRVVKGPSNPDVFATPPDILAVPPLSDEAVKLVSEIRSILGGIAPATSPKRREQEQAPPLDPLVHRRRRRELAILMGTLLDEVTRAQTLESSRSNSPGSPLCDLSIVVGDISPHRGASPESAETPVSYSQLNYNQNIERYFQSQPKLLPSESSSSKGFDQGTNSSSCNSKTNSGRTSGGEQSLDKDTRSADSTVNTKCYSGQANDSQSQLLSSEQNSASGSGSGQMRRSRTETSGVEDSYHGPELTTDILLRHNAEMEQDFMDQAKAFRIQSLGKGRKERRGSQGVKRGVGSSWGEGSGGNPNNHKHSYKEFAAMASPGLAGMGVPFIPVTLWPPFSLSTQSGSYPAPIYTMPSSATTGFDEAGMTTSTTPMHHANSPYFIGQPAGSGQPQIMQQMFMQPQGSNLAMPYMSGMVAYQPLYIPQTYMLPSVPFATPAAVDDQRTREPSLIATARGPRQGVINRCDSLTTSVNAEPGSEAPSHCSFVAGKDVGIAGIDKECPVSEIHSVDEDPDDCWNNPFAFRFGPENSEDHQIRLDDFMKGDPDLCDQSSNGSWLESARQALPTVRSTPPWMQSIESTPELVYRYQLPNGPSLSDILEKDREALQQLHQPAMLNDQLVALYREFEAEDTRTRMLNLDEGENTTSSSCMSGEEQSAVRNKRKTRRRDDFRRSMIFEENASLPSPDSA